MINRSKTWDIPLFVTAFETAAMFGTQVALTIWAVGNARRYRTYERVRGDARSTCEAGAVHI